MSNTRRATDNSAFRQERFASAPEFERGLMANLVAKRCAILERREDRQLIWFIQRLSHQNGGIKKLAAELTAKYQDRMATPAMKKYGMRPGQIYSAKQACCIREEMKDDGIRLSGEIQDLDDFNPVNLLSESEKNMIAFKALKRREAQSFPENYPAADFIRHCKNSAEQELKKFIVALALSPGIAVADGAPWYFPTLVSTLREYQGEWIAARQPQVVTTIGETIGDALAYSIARRKLVIIDGMARTGKTHATKAWCGLNPGTARYMQCPASNDDFSFFRDIALSLGVSVNLKSKSQELRSRVEEVLRGGDLALIIDEAHYLWPQSHFRNTTPGRINWLMTALVNQGVAVALITTPQFFRSLSAIERVTCWTSDQFKGRIGRYVKLPDVLSRDQLEEVAGVLLPGANIDSIRALARYAECSGKYLGAMDAVADSALYLCQMDNRQKVEFKDVERAIRESVTPSDEALKAAFDSAADTKRRRVSRVVAMPMQGDFQRDAAPLQGPDFSRRETAPARQVKPQKAELLPG